MLEESADQSIPGGAPIGPDLFQAAAVQAANDAAAQRQGNTLQQLLDYLSWLSTDPVQRERFLGATAADRQGAIVSVGQLDVTGQRRGLLQRAAGG